MKTKYSKKEFKGYTHRFIVKLKVDNDWRNDTNINIYSNSSSYVSLHNFINKKKSNEVVDFDIIHRATKEQDEMSSKLIEETLKNI